MSLAPLICIFKTKGGGDCEQTKWLGARTCTNDGYHFYLQTPCRWGWEHATIHIAVQHVWRRCYPPLTYQHFQKLLCFYFVRSTKHYNFGTCWSRNTRVLIILRNQWVHRQIKKVSNNFHCWPFLYISVVNFEKIYYA